MTKTSQPERKATLYKRSPTSLVIEEAARINQEISQSELVERITEMEHEIQSYREETGTGSPEDAVLEDQAVDEELLYEWRSTRRNLRFAKAALAISQAEETVEQSCIDESRVEIVARAAHKLWRRVYEQGSFEDVNAAENPPQYTVD